MSLRFFSEISFKIILRRVNFVTINRNVRVTRWPTVENPWVEEQLAKKPVFEKRPETIGYRSDNLLFKYVEKILPQEIVPDVPSSLNYPTPSGWVPPKAEAITHPYIVHRTRNHMLPVYFEERTRKNSEQTFGKRQFTIIRKIDGDIWKLEADLRSLLEHKVEGPYLAQVSEVSRLIRIEGIFLEDISQFLLNKGF